MFQISRDRRAQRKMHEIGRVKVAKQAERQVSRRPRMSGQSDTCLSRLQHSWVMAELLKSFRRQVATLKQRESQIRVQRRSGICARRRNGALARLRGFRPSNPSQQ
jgi:hypothetical protein